MQTERVTFLTTPDHKAALDAFASSNGMSVGHVVREATTSFIAQESADEEEVRSAILQEVQQAMPQMQEDLDAIRASIADARAAIAAVLRGSAGERHGRAA